MHARMPLCCQHTVTLLQKPKSRQPTRKAHPAAAGASAVLPSGGLPRVPVGGSVPAASDACGPGASAVPGAPTLAAVLSCPAPSGAVAGTAAGLVAAAAGCWLRAGVPGAEPSAAAAAAAAILAAAAAAAAARSLLEAAAASPDPPGGCVKAADTVAAKSGLVCRSVCHTPSRGSPSAATGCCFAACPCRGNRHSRFYASWIQRPTACFHLRMPEPLASSASPIGTNVSLHRAPELTMQKQNEEYNGICSPLPFAVARISDLLRAVEW